MRLALALGIVAVIALLADLATSYATIAYGLHPGIATVAAAAFGYLLRSTRP